MSALTREEIRAALVEVLLSIAPETDAATLAPDEPLRSQLDLDSFDFLNVVIRLHERLGVDVPETDYAALATLNGAVDYLARRIETAHQG